MSEKRFVYGETDLFEWVEDNGEMISTKECVNKLNELYEENEQLKNDDLLFFQQVFNILMKYQHLFNREMADEVLEDLGIELTEWFE